MNHHQITNGKCEHCESFRLPYELIDGVCSRSLPRVERKPSPETIGKAVADMAKRKLVTKGRPGWNK